MFNIIFRELPIPLLKKMSKKRRKSEPVLTAASVSGMMVNKEAENTTVQSYRKESNADIFRNHLINEKIYILLLDNNTTR